MKIVAIKNFVFNSDYFHSANVAWVPRRNKDGSMSETKDCVLQLYLWVPEAQGNHNLRQINIAEDTVEGTVRLYVHMLGWLSPFEFQKEDREALVADLVSELSGPAARKSTAPPVDPGTQQGVESPPDPA